MKARIQAILLATDDLPRALAFYEAMGFEKERSGGSTAIFSIGETQLALVGSDVFQGILGQAPDAATAAPRQVLAHMERSQEGVDQIMAKAEAAGATVVKKPGSNDWGGYNGAFADPDGHVWNIGFNLLFYRA